MDVLTLLLAAAGLIVAAVALGMVLRDRGGAGSDRVSSARQLADERQIGQLVKRLDVLEGEVDAAITGEAGDGANAATELSRRSSAAVSHIGLVRFDAFEDAGGAQSFSLALLDDGGSGVVLTSLHSRPTTRVYVKAIRNATADAPLSEEEARALKEAGFDFVEA